MSDITQEKAKTCINKIFSDIENVKNTLVDTESLSAATFEFSKSYNDIVNNLLALQEYFKGAETKETTKESGVITNTK